MQLLIWRGPRPFLGILSRHHVAFIPRRVILRRARRGGPILVVVGS